MLAWVRAAYIPVFVFIVRRFALTFFYSVVRIWSPWKPTGQSAISSIGLQFLGRHPIECFSERRIFKFYGLSRSTFRTIGDFPGGLHVAAHSIANLRFSDKVRPRATFRVVRDWLFELVSVCI